jgi:hypothetical protein
MNRYRIEWRHGGGALVMAYSAADAKTQAETRLGWTPRPYDGSTPEAGPVALIEPAPPLGEWTCACGVTWTGATSPRCGACGKLSVPMWVGMDS